MPKFAANLTMLYGELDFLDRFEAAAEDGFAGVEYLFPYPYPKEALAERLRRHGLVQVLHNLPAGDWGKGERGIACLPERVDEFRDGVDRAIEYATALGCEQVNCLVGIRPENVSEAAAHRTLVANLRFAAAKLARTGIKLLLEPINPFDIPGFFVRTPDQAARIIAEVGADNLFIQYDFYHQQRTAGELAATFRKHQSRIAHVQIADNPGRHEPGTGEINFPFLFRLLDEAGYRGWIGCEYKPGTTTREGLAWLAPHRTRSA
ncbi:hydroxypyruvate isomerase [Benzoatithermus flavus]|uniref:Hydroxypyruvate isomerase n=1 Tax=Benzoatithermus flavus TaxID=3108223 RepID=A0ABU8XKP3_9PROT